MRRRPRRAETRRRVLEAAVTVFGRRGIATASVNDVAAAAGLTKGAVYSSFASKDDLVHALMQEHVLGVEADLARARDALDAGAGEATRAHVGAVLSQMASSDARWHRLLGEYVETMDDTDEHVVDLRRSRRQVRDAIAATLERFADLLELDLPLPAQDAAVVLLALSAGLAAEERLAPGTVAPDLLTRLLTGSGQAP